MARPRARAPFAKSYMPILTPHIPDPHHDLAGPAPEAAALRDRFLSGSAVLLAGSGLATVVNFAYNMAVARFLGPTGFGNVTAVYTLLVLISAITLSFQIVAAKVVAQQGTLAEKISAYRGFRGSAWFSGISIALLCILFRNTISEYLHLPSPLLLVWLGVGAAFYVPLGTRRGYLQGACGFRHLAVNLVLEGFVRLCGSLLCILLGFGVMGVIAANAAAIAVAYIFAIPRLPQVGAHLIRIPHAFREALQAIVFFVGQVVINNCDIVVVKHFFPPVPAGLYAAVALVGRVIFAFSWAIVNTMFPIVAGSHDRKQQHHGVLGASLGLVLLLGAGAALILRLAPAFLWTALFGSQFFVVGNAGLPYLLALYAATTCVYSLSVVIIAYEMSHKIANTGWVQLAFSGVLIAGIYRFHSSLQEVILVQLIMMTILLLVVLTPFLRDTFFDARSHPAAPSFPGLRVLRSVTEDEVVAEFLRNDFQNPEFADYRTSLASLVNLPNLDDAAENAKRRALLFIRHGSLWRELPNDTEWYEVQVQSQDLPQIRVFPRAQWRKLAHGEYMLTEIARSLEADPPRRGIDKAFLTKIHNLRKLVSEQNASGAVLLIGVNEAGPFTILDGNHRLVAATLVSPMALHNLRFFCGLSPRMIQCCWYKTSLGTLVHYGSNLLRHAVRDPEEELVRLLQPPVSTARV